MVAAEVVETRRVFARCVAGIEAKWVGPCSALGEAQLFRSALEPKARRGGGLEKVTL